MALLPPVNEIKELVALFAPGMIILWPISRVRIGPVPEFRERAISYAVATTAYFAAISPFFYIESGVGLPIWLWTSLQYALLPAAIGWLLAYCSQRGLEYKIADRFGLQLSHHIPAAWDFTFSQMAEGKYILVTLKDGSRIGGIFDSASFSSSSKDERDMLIGDVWNVDEKEGWHQADPPRSALLCGGDIHYIEIF